MAKKSGSPTKGKYSGSSDITKGIDIESWITNNNAIIIFSLTFLAFIVRIWGISFPNNVVFDELHTGSYINKYINGAYFVDIHPPLGKLIYSFTAWHFGYDATFNFERTDQPFAPSVPYTAFRGLSAFLSSLTIPLGYRTLEKLGAPGSASVLASLLLICENSFVVQNRFFLTDSILLFFISFSIYEWISFISIPKKEEFTFKWYTTLLFAGASLGAAISVRFCASYAILTVGSILLINLWYILGDLERSPKDLFANIFVRLVGVSAIPLIVYLLTFTIHLHFLSNTGSGTSFMTQEFQSSLNGTPKVVTQEDVGYGSFIRLVHEGTSGGFIHSHAHNYPGGSQQQQVSAYPFRDSNNVWIIQKPVRGNNGTLPPAPIKGFERIGHGSVIRLVHNTTLRKLHSHDVRAPLTDNEHHNEVSCYGDANSIGDLNDNWKVELLDNNVEDTTVKALSTRFRLKHTLTGCYLFSHEVSLPDWGFSQQEVTCAKNGKKELETFRIDFNENKYQETPKFVSYRQLNLLEKIVEIHKTIWRLSNRVKDIHPSVTDAFSWPFINKVMVYFSSRAKSSNIILVGNLFIYGIAIFSIFGFISMEGGATLLEKRQISVESTVLGKFRYAGWITTIAYITNFIPYVFSKQQIFLSNYIPALYFGILLTGVQFSRIGYGISFAKRNLLLIVIVGISASVFFKFAPLSYGYSLPHKVCESLKLRSDWEWDCFEPKA